MVEGDEFHEMEVEEVISEDYTPEFDRNHMDIDEDLENEENEVLAEYKVLITQQLSNCLYQLQFPTRLHKFSNEFEPKVGRIKPTSKQLELEVPFTDNNEHYDRRKGFNFGSGLHNKPMKSATESLFQSQDENLPSLSSQTFVSELIPNAANYMIGVINQDELHLTPLSGTLRLSPGFQYLDKIHEKEKSLNQRVNAQEEKENDPDKVIESKLIQVQMKKREESKEEAEKANQLKLRKQIEDESWSNLVLFNQNTDESIDLVDHLYGNSDSKVECISQPIDYLNEVGPKLTDR
ncbi:DNA-directed RNA polymerase III subunit RPC5 [Clydaea vesicula]|uniref:DNA-directed RNA polymerase III subunit RPC5 n=1 Tax=Clydaea vesicula TaxID=447962 RepID=A0AAD5TVD7_9FUNG|nr:DNA-directed RNA polymerase III subunit RPC5 [Clydaea vesicula]